MSTYPKPIPQPTEDNAEFLAGLRRGEVRLQRCDACGRFRYPCARFCPYCLSADAQWLTTSGRGRIYSFIVVHQLYHPGFRGDLPYNVAVIQLDEGPRLTSNVVGCDNAALRIDMPVVADVQQVDAGDDVAAAILKFRPA
jgi:hypothetical protein